MTEYVPTPTNRATHIMRRIKSHKVAVECPKDCACTREDDS